MRYPLLAGACFFAYCLPAFGQSQVFIRSLNFNGTGCDPLSARGQLYDTDRNGLPEQFEIIFSQYIAQQGPNIAPIQRRKNCNITVQLHLPVGYQYSVTEVRYLGFADLPAGVNGRQRSSYEFPFSTNPVTFESIVLGPYNQNYDRTDRISAGTEIWSPCGTEAPLNIRTEVRLEGNSVLPAAISTDQIDGFVRQIYGLNWRPCR